MKTGHMGQNAPASVAVLSGGALNTVDGSLNPDSTLPLIEMRGNWKHFSTAARILDAN